MFLSIDFILAVLIFVGVFVASLFLPEIQQQGRTLLLVEAGLGVAVLAVALTALSILVAFLGEEYVRILRQTELGIAGAIRPYRVIAVVSGSTTLAALVSILLWQVPGPDLRGLAVALSSGLAVWCVVGTVQLVGITAKHGEYRGRVPEIRDAFLRGQEERRKHSA